ncbi:hypothetical protein BJV82DRAFT_609667 [Fennellomyces sp. T-0311]|nr:hypothetical protein BJV82DRAFT_609667 [Fennellomyces sp. T-0311]
MRTLRPFCSNRCLNRSFGEVDRLISCDTYTSCYFLLSIASIYPNTMRTYQWCDGNKLGQRCFEF